MMRVFYDGDGYPPIGLYFKFFDVAVSVFLPEVKSVQKLTFPPTVYHNLWSDCKVYHAPKAEIRVIVGSHVYDRTE